MTNIYPIPSGKYSVGCIDVMTISSSEDEGIFFRMYYPVEKQDVTKDVKSLRKALTDEEFEKVNKGFVAGISDYRFVQWFFSGLMSNDLLVPVKWNENIVSNKEKFPFILFAPGFLGNRCTYEALCSDLASRGFVVATIEFRDGSVGWSYKMKRSENGEFIKEDIPLCAPRLPMNPNVFANFNETDKLFIDFNKIVHKHVSECDAVLKLLENINDGGTQFLQGKIVPNDNFDLNQFKNRIDLTNATLMGHSLGGSTSVLAMTISKKFKNFISLDGNMLLVEKEVFDKIYPNKNCLFIFADANWSGKAGNIERSSKIIETNEGKENLAINTCVYLKPSQHMTFCDMAFSRSMLMKLLNWGKISPQLGHKIIADLTVSFLASGNENVRSEKTFKEIYNENVLHLEIVQSDILGKENA